MISDELLTKISEIIKGCSGLTSGSVVIYNDIIILRSEDGCILEVIPVDNTGIILSTSIADINYYLDPKFPTINKLQQYQQDFYKLLDLYNYYNSYNNYSPVYLSEDLKTDHENYLTCLGYKLTDSLGWIKIPGNNTTFMMPVCKVITPVNKPDTVAFKIFPETETTSIYKYEIYKKKFKTSISVYLRTLNLI